MQYLDNGMDDLFRRAAENYPLKTSEKNWDDISVMLAIEPPALLPVNNHKFYFTAFLLLISLFIGLSSIVFFINHQLNKRSRQGLAKEKKLLIIPASAKVYLNNADKSLQKEAGLINDPGIQTKDKINHISIEKNKLRNFMIVEKEENIHSVNVQTYLPVYNANSPSVNGTLPFFKSQLLQHVSEEKTSVTIPFVPANALKQNLSLNKRYGFYFGISCGPQLNQVKDQGFNKTGLSLDLRTGYQFNKRFSFETGIGWSHKYFFTDGKYFDMSKAASSMPANIAVLSLNSSSNVLEVPVIFKYYAEKEKYQHFFITAGISSYVLTKESNKYLAVINGLQQNMYGSYTTHKGYISAAAQFSVGYEYRTGKNTTISAAPYLQVPLKGIGIGDVRVMTAGLHIGITKYIQ